MRQQPPRIACLFGIVGGLICLGSLQSVEADEALFRQRLADFLQRARSTRTPGDHKSLALDLWTAAGEAMQANEFSTAVRLATLAVESARKSGNEHALFLASARKEQAAPAAKEFRKVSRDFDQLQRSPHDPDANFAVGRFICLVKDDWATGLGMLARGSDARYRTVALLELKKPTGLNERLGLVKAWSDLASAESPPFSSPSHVRAYYWARQALTSAAGPQREHVRRLMTQLPILYLTDLQESEARPGPWPLGKYGDAGDGSRITVSGIPYPNGLGLHPPSSGFASVKYNLDGAYETFSSGVAIADHQQEVRGPVAFWVLGDGKVLWKSPPIPRWGDALQCRVSVRDVKVLELRTQAERGQFGAHAAWLDPYVSR